MVFTALQMSSSLVATGALLKGLVFKMKESVFRLRFRCSKISRTSIGVTSPNSLPQPLIASDPLDDNRMFFHYPLII